jgi:hypothetical protein
MVSIPDVSAQGRIAGRPVEVPWFFDFVFRPAFVSAPTSALACGDLTPLVSQRVIGIAFSAERWLACLVFVLAVVILFARAGHNNFIPVTVPYPTFFQFSYVFVCLSLQVEHPASSSSSRMALSREILSFGVESNPPISHGIGLLSLSTLFLFRIGSFVILLGFALRFHSLLVTLASVFELAHLPHLGSTLAS